MTSLRPRRWRRWGAKRRARCSLVARPTTPPTEMWICRPRRSRRSAQSLIIDRWRRSDLRYRSTANLEKCSKWGLNRSTRRGWWWSGKRWRCKGSMRGNSSWRNSTDRSKRKSGGSSRCWSPTWCSRPRLPSTLSRLPSTRPCCSNTCWTAQTMFLRSRTCLLRNMTKATIASPTKRQDPCKRLTLSRSPFGLRTTSGSIWNTLNSQALRILTKGKSWWTDTNGYL